MPIFIYKAVNEKGVIVRNKVEEVNRKILIKKLKKNDLMPINIVQVKRIISKSKQKQKKNISDVNNVLKDVNTSNYIQTTINKPKNNIFSKIGIKFDKRIKMRDIILFTQDLYLLKKANFNNIHALSTIIQTTENDQLREIIKDILAGVESGENMYTTMEYYSDIFPYLYINMIKVGEQSGSLIKSLEEAVTYLDDTEKFNKKIRSMLLPNIILLSVIMLLLVVGLLFVLPLLQRFYSSMGIEDQIPKFTIKFSNFVRFLLKIWYIPLITIAGIVYMFIKYINTPKGRYNLDFFKYRIPLFGKLIFNIDFTRFSRAMLLNLNNGIRIQDSLEVSKNVVKNSVLRSLIESSINNMILGQSWVEPFEKSGLASPMIVEMLNIGMTTDLKEMMLKMLEYLQIDTDNTIIKITKALPNIIYLIVGVALIFVVLVVLVPCINAYMGTGILDAAGI